MLRFTYTMLGVALALTVVSFYVNGMFSNAMSNIGGRIYQMGCYQGARKNSAEDFNRCAYTSETFEATLKELLDK